MPCCEICSWAFVFNKELDHERVDGVIPLIGHHVHSFIVRLLSGNNAGCPTHSSTGSFNGAISDSANPARSHNSTIANATTVPSPTPTEAPKVALSTRVIIEPAQAIRSGMPAYAKPGQYSVGLRYIHIPIGEFELDGYVWYPVQKPAGTPDTSGGPFPLVIFASGAQTGALSCCRYLLSHFAAYGFVIISWDPRMEGENFWHTIGYRSLDYRRIVDAAEEMAASGGPLAGMIDLRRIAIAGHSLGGGTALIESGAQIDFGWCAAHQDLVSKDQEKTCREFSNHQQEIADDLGLKSVPEGAWPQMGDPRIAAMIAMAPVGKLFGADYQGVSSIGIPSLIVTGSNDVVLQPELSAYPIYEHLGSPDKSLVVFENKGHAFFCGMGSEYNLTVEDIDRLENITVAFLLAEMKGDSEAAKALSPANINMPGIRYETTEFNGK